MVSSSNKYFCALVTPVHEDYVTITIARVKFQIVWYFLLHYCDECESSANCVSYGMVDNKNQY